MFLFRSCALCQHLRHHLSCSLRLFLRLSGVEVPSGSHQNRQHVPRQFTLADKQPCNILFQSLCFRAHLCLEKLMVMSRSLFSAVNCDSSLQYFHVCASPVLPFRTAQKRSRHKGNIGFHGHVHRGCCCRPILGSHQCDLLAVLPHTAAGPNLSDQFVSRPWTPSYHRTFKLCFLHMFGTNFWVLQRGVVGARVERHV